MQRLQKLMSEAGLCSRRAAEEYIKSGRVTVNGVVASLGDSASAEDVVAVDGKEITAQEHVYIMLYKPRGYVTTMADEQGRKDITLFTKNMDKRVYPVGRLDMQSEGLILLTNDGAVTKKLTHPSSHISKEYLVGISAESGNAAPEESLSVSIFIDGRWTAPARCRVVSKKSETKYLVTITIFDGRNRQIRRLCENAGYKIDFLKRTRIGDIKLSGLTAGEWRYLHENEIEYLRRL